MLCKIGEVEVWRILDWHAPFLEPATLFPNAPADVARIIEDRAPGSMDASTGKLILPVQGFLLKTPGHVILVDACVGNDKTNERLPSWHGRTDTRFMASLSAAGVSPSDVDYVMCTHLHVDHVGWNTRLENGQWVPTFPNARYLLPAADTAMYAATPSDSYTESVLPVIAAGQAELVGTAHQLGEEVSLLPTPGHTPGHVSIKIRSLGAEAIITGDAIHSSAQCAHPTWHFKFDSDPEAAVQSRRLLLETAAETQAKVIGSHFTLPSLGQVQIDAEAFSWVPI